jgi:carboxyl-terminal processing protease
MGVGTMNSFAMSDVSEVQILYFLLRLKIDIFVRSNKFYINKLNKSSFMDKFRFKITIYLPILFALVLIAGILLGVRLAPKSAENQGFLPINLSQGNKISEILSFIERDYVDTVNIENLSDEAVSRILEKLDPHSQYIAASELNHVNEQLEGNFEGIGVQFRIENDTVMVVLPISGGPSEKVGIKAGDRIVIVDKDTIAGKGIQNPEVMKRLKGKRGTKVNLGVFRRGEKELIDFTITRDVIPTYSVDVAYMVNSSTGYIKINSFTATTQKEFSKALDELHAEGLSKLILDLRGNAGGYLQAAIDVADEFLKDESLIVYTKGQNRPKNFAFATKRGNFEEGQLVVLIDEGSASASEIVAGAIQDNDRGTIIGRRSFGKGLVQEQRGLTDGSALRLTVARYYTPTGRCIQKPYKEGTEAYYEEFHDRFVNGEVLHADSIHFNDSLKYTTPGGKVVYGGGGIMPDIFIPIENGENMAYYNRLINRGIIYDFAFEYTDTHRAEFSQFKDYKNFDSGFIVSETMFEDLVKLAAKKDIARDVAGINARKEEIKILLKALIGRNILDDLGFYPIYLQKDQTFQKTLEFLEGKKMS